MEFYTIGVYNSTETVFFKKLIDYGIDTFCDIRQRRGVRGSKYSFVNSRKLQEKLKKLDVKYLHYLDLAPTKKIRELQRNIDLKKSELKSNRSGLGEIFIEEYNKEIINNFNFDNFIKVLRKDEAKKVALFCVEENHKACHRSLVSNKLSSDFNFNVIHI